MTIKSRQEILTNLSQHLGYPMLAYVTSDRPAMATQISLDQIRLFPRHLSSIGQVSKLGVILHTLGGDINAPWPIVNMIREHCETLVVLIPRMALSSGTLLALGADEIVMTRYANVSPIDPTVANEFNPQNPMDPNTRLAISVEDVLAYLELSKTNVKGDALSLAYARLTESLHPLALGNVQRSINMIRSLAKKMIGLQGRSRTEVECDSLIKALTTEFYSHQHQIGRNEAKSIGLDVSCADDATEKLLLEYWDEIGIDLELNVPFNPAEILRLRNASALAGSAVALQSGGQPVVTPAPVGINLERGYVETAQTCDAFITRGEIALQQVQGPMGMQNGIALQVFTEMWEKVV